ncbi:MAG: hypothetical protein H0U43_00570, partial [Chthoniobacterales bacterium]|nr:hypothetical protein [Chthoniobacterales bacterium]
TSTLARESDGSRSDSESKPRSSKQGKTTRSKSSSTKKKSASTKSKKSRRASEKKLTARAKQSSQLRDTGDIDVSGTVWEDLPPEDLPTNEPESADEDPAP